MKRNWVLRILKFAFFAILFLAVVTFFVMRLWNWLTPALFGWHVITYWQALGLLVLSKILFGGLRGGPRRHWRWRGTDDGTLGAHDPRRTREISQ